MADAKFVTDIVSKRLQEAEDKFLRITQLKTDIKDRKITTLNLDDNQLLLSESELSAELLILNKLSASISSAVEAENLRLAAEENLRLAAEDPTEKEHIHVIGNIRGARFTYTPRNSGVKGRHHTIEVGEEASSKYRQLNNFMEVGGERFILKVSDAFESLLGPYITSLRTAALDKYTVPGTNISSYVLDPLFKLLIKSGIDILIDNYAVGKTLKEDLKASDLFVKKGLLMLGCKVNLTVNRNKRQRLASSFKCLAKIIRTNILGGQSLTKYPLELTMLLDLMDGTIVWPTQDAGVTARLHLLKNHVALMNHLKAAEFTSRLHNVQAWLAKDVPKQKAFSNAVSTGLNVNGAITTNWGSLVNAALLPVFVYHPDPNKMILKIPRYDHNNTTEFKYRIELIRFLRNCMQHLGEHYQNQQIAFSEEDCSRTIAATFPGVLANLQFQLSKNYVLKDVLGY